MTDETILWESIRHKWPKEPGNYHVYDCRWKVEGKAIYDGYDFIIQKWIYPRKGATILIDYIVTHWLPMETCDD